MKRLILIILAAALSACDSSGGGDGLTEIRFVNLVADSDRVVFQVREDNFPVVDFRLATPYQRFGGTYEYDLELVRLDNTLSTLVEDRVLTVDGDNEWTFYAVGTVGAPDFFPAVAANGDPAEGFAKIQFVNATQETVTSYVYASGQFGPGTQASATVGARNYAAPTEVQAQSVQVRVERADGSVAFDSSPFDLASLADVTFVVTDYLGPGAAVSAGEVLKVDHAGLVEAVATTGRPATLRYVHALTNLPDAIVTRTDALQASSDTTLAFATGSPRESVDAGTYDITVAPADNPGAPIYATQASPEQGLEYSLLLVGDLATPDSLLLVDDTRPVATVARIVFMHGAPGLAGVDVYVSEVDQDNLTGIVFPAVAHRSTLRLDLPGEARNITVVTAGTTDVVAGPLEVNFAAGAVETALLHDAETGGSPFGLSIL